MTNWIHVWYKPSGSIKPTELSALIVDTFVNGVQNLAVDQLN
jgi:hypothetical protein